MTALPLTLTTAGLERFTAAQVDADIDLTISSVGLTDRSFVAAPTLTALPGRFREVETISGEAVGSNIVHLMIRDDAEITYTVRGFGLFLADGTLFAAYGQEQPIFEKAVSAAMLIALDLAFPTSDIDQLTFGDTNFLNPPATTETKGVVELATQAEADAGTDPRRVAPVAVMRATIAAMIAPVTAAIGSLSNSVDRRLADLTASLGLALDGLAARTVYGGGLVTGGGRNDTNRTLTVEAASLEQVRAGAANNVVVTPAGLVGFVRVVESKLTGNSGYIVYSNGLKECWGVVNLPSESATEVPLPVPHTTFCVPVGSGSRATADEMNIGIIGVNGGPPTSFSIRNGSPEAVTFFWHAKGV